jgi:hypothetical protein
MVMQPGTVVVIGTMFSIFLSRVECGLPHVFPGGYLQIVREVYSIFLSRVECGSATLGHVFPVGYL